MKKRILLLCLTLCLLLSLAACGGSKTISVEDAQQVVLADLGKTAGQVEMHMHVGEYDGKPCYSIYVTVDGQTLEYLIDSSTGEILDIQQSSHSH